MKQRQSSVSRGDIRSRALIFSIYVFLPVSVSLYLVFLVFFSVLSSRLGLGSRVFVCGFRLVGWLVANLVWRFALCVACLLMRGGYGCVSHMYGSLFFCGCLSESFSLFYVGRGMSEMNDESHFSEAQTCC
jgi:hypothetical protein